VRRLFLILIILLNSNLCFGAESLTINLGDDYLIATEKPIKANFVSNPETITVSPFFTIFNEKNILLLHPTKEGKSKLMVVLDDGGTTFEVTVKPKGKRPTFVTVTKGDFELILLDAPPSLEEIEIDAPPSKYKEGN